jgi:hypothetical protein
LAPSPSLCLTDVHETTLYGTERHLEIACVRGSRIRYIHLRDDIDPASSIMQRVCPRFAQPVILSLSALN